MVKKSFEKKLESIRREIGETVIFSIGMNKSNKFDIIGIQVFPKDDKEEETPEVINYVG
ncbi:MAG: hypothetical protein ISS01_02775 [Nanoarchaeota archaeon]|nr:hypothetical protein [Nanoarchaeota archaeon]